MLKVCGITFDNTANYGSCLQAYALKTVIENTDIANQNCKYELITLRKLKGRVDSIPFYKEIAGWIIRIPFSKFERVHQRFIEIKHLSELYALNDTYDAFICGSDVIWIPDRNNYLDVYFLTFAQKYAFSYAASFGKSCLGDEYLTMLKERMSHLRQISVREESGVEIVKKYTDNDARLDLDPVCLLTSDQWDMLLNAGNKEKNIGDYIFYYSTYPDYTQMEFCSRLSEQTNLKIIKMTATRPSQFLKLHTYPISPEKWILYIKNAKYVVTNSFHAVAFSTIYHKEFYFISNGDKYSGRNIRIYDFLERFGLENRIIKEASDKFDKQIIDYDHYDEVIEKLRRQSLQYIKENLEKAQSEKQSRG